MQLRLQFLHYLRSGIGAELELLIIYIPHKGLVAVSRAGDCSKTASDKMRSDRDYV